MCAGSLAVGTHGSRGRTMTLLQASQNYLRFHMPTPALSGLAGFAKTLALPGESKPLRFPSFPALERTAVLALNHCSSFNLGSTSSRVLLSRQATYPLWTSQITSYAAYFEIGGTDAWEATQNTTGKINAMAAGGGLTSGTFSYPPTFSGYTAPALKLPIIGRDSDTTSDLWIYAPKGTDLAFGSVFSGNPGVGEQGFIEFDSWISPGEVVSQTLNVPLAAFAGQVYAVWQLPNIDSNIWIRPTRWGSTSASPSVKFTPFLQVGVHTGGLSANFSTYRWTFTSSTREILMPLATLPDYFTSALPWSATRVTATAALFTNTTKALNKEGTVLWARVDPLVHNPWSVPEASLAAFHPAEKAYLPLEKGTYTYTMPSSDMSTFVDYTYIFTPGYMIPVCRLDHTGLVNVGIFSDADFSTPTQLAVNLDVHLEFRTTSALFNIGMASSPVEMLHQAQLVLMKTGFFFENESHDSIIMRAIRALASAAPMLSIMGPIGKGMAAGIRAANVMVKSGPHKPAPTTLNVRTARPGRRPRAQTRRRNRNRTRQQQPPRPQKKKGGLQMYLDSKSRV